MTERLRELWGRGAEQSISIFFFPIPRAEFSFHQIETGSRYYLLILSQGLTSLISYWVSLDRYVFYLLRCFNPQISETMRPFSLTQTDILKYVEEERMSSEIKLTSRSKLREWSFLSRAKNIHQQNNLNRLTDDYDHEEIEWILSIIIWSPIDVWRNDRYHLSYPIVIDSNISP